MNDLIRRSALIKVLKDRATNESIMGYMTAYDVTKSIIDEVEEQPTAYDIDKVVEEFDKKYNNSLWIKGNEEFSITRNELLEIVKQGGIADDVCEWEYKHPFGDFPSCKNVNSISRDRNWKYCPYCGKKIKVVE